jgi:hypothetical protein
MYLRPMALDPGNLQNNRLGVQDVRGGYSISLPLTLTNPAIGEFREYVAATGAVGSVINSVSIPGGDNLRRFHFKPLANGSGTASFTPPAGSGVPVSGGFPYLQNMPTQVTGGVPAGQANLSLLPGTTAAASTEFNSSYRAALAIDGIDGTGSSWCTANNDPAPRLTVTFPNLATVRSFVIVTSWSPTYDFLTGRLKVLDASDAVLYDSGVQTFTNGAISLSVPVAQQLPGAKKVEFSGVTWKSIEPCLSELAIGGSVP